MTEHLQKLADDVLETVGDRATAHVSVTEQRHGLTRFANSFIHQHVDEDTTRVGLRVVVDGQPASGSTTDTRPDRLRASIDRLIEIARLAPVEQDWQGFAPPVDSFPDDRHDPETAANDPDARAALVERFITLGHGSSVAGYCDTETTTQAISASTGLRGASTTTRATLDGIHRTDSSSGSGHATSYAIGDLDADEIGELARDRAERGRDPHDLSPGDLTVVLGPEAVATILIFLSIYGFNAKSVHEGQSFAEIGAAQFDPSITIRDGFDDARAIGLAFDEEGTPRAPLTLVDGGTTAGLTHDRRTAAKMGVESTGHAIPNGEHFGAVTMTTRLRPGTSTPEELIAEVDHGLYIASFNYCRILDPKSQVVTGLTRNGTYRIRGGDLVAGVSNLRFTTSFKDAFGPGNVLGVADDDRMADCEFGTGLTIAPHVALRSFHISGGASG